MITIPTITELYNDILADLEGQFDITIPLIGKSFLRALAAVQAAKLKLFYLSIGYLQKNIFVDTADSEANGGTLERFGRVKLGRNPFPALPGEYTVSVVGTVGSVIAASTTFKSNDDSLSPGILYILDDEYTLVSNPDTITLRALTAGNEGKLSIGDNLTATAPIANVNSQVAVTAETVEPQAAQDIEDYRQQVLNSFQLEPQGGSATDYRLWAQDAQGVKETYPYANSEQSNEINLYVEATIADSSDSKGTPTQGILDAVEEDVEPKRPLGVFQVNYLPVTPLDIDITINGFSPSPDTETQDLIETAITDMINEIRPFISGIDILAGKNDILDVNKIITAIISALPGSVFSSVTMEVDSVELLAKTFTNGDIPFLSSIAYA